MKGEVGMDRFAFNYEGERRMEPSRKEQEREGFNETDDTLEYATPVENGTGNCASTDWQCDSIEDIGADAKDLAIAIDENDYPVIAYHATSGTSEALRTARPSAALGVFPNCGPGGLGWYCGTVDPGSADIQPGGSLDMAVRPSGDRVIAYQSIYWPMSWDLKVAYHHWSIFSDGFELGDLSRWSSVVQ